MAAPKGRCPECGAGLVPGSGSCPLCGTDGDEGRAKPVKESERDSYYANVRALRTELTKLRKGARAS